MKEYYTKDEITVRLEKCFTTYKNMVFRLAISQTRNQTYAEDILGEVFLRLVKNIEKLHSEEHIKSWLIRTTINCSKTYLKKMSRECLSVPEDLPCFSEPEINDVYTAVSALREKYRTVIHLFYFEDMKIKDISRVMRQSESATKMQLKRGKEMLKTILRDDYDED